MLVADPPVQGTILNPLSEQEARHKLDEAKTRLKSAAGQLDKALEIMLELAQRGGAEALGYASFAQLYDKEFQFVLDRSRSQYFRLLNYVEFVPQLSPAGDSDEAPSQQSIRPLIEGAFARSASAQDKLAVFEAARERAKLEGKDNPTKKMVEEETVRWRVEHHEPRYSSIITWMEREEVSPTTALHLCQALTETDPTHRELMQGNKVKSVALVHAMYRSRESEGYAEAVKQGGFWIVEDSQDVFVPLAIAEADQWRNFMNQRQHERIEQSRANHIPGQVVSIIVYPGVDPVSDEATYRSLLEVLGGQQLERLFELHHRKAQP